MLGNRRQEEKEATEDEMVGWLHRLNGHEFNQTSRDREGQGSLYHSVADAIYVQFRGDLKP